MRRFAVTTPTRTILDLHKSNHLERDIIVQATSEALKKLPINPKKSHPLSRWLFVVLSIKRRLRVKLPYLTSPSKTCTQTEGA